MKLIKKIFFFYLLFFLNFNAESNDYKILATIAEEAITLEDLKNENKIIKLLNKNITLSEERINKLSLKNLIEEKIKEIEIKKNNIQIEKKIINNYFQTFLKNLNIKQSPENEKILNLIYKKIKIENEWNNLIIKKFGWKINVNINEIDKKIKDLEKNSDLEVNKFISKQKLIDKEKEKKIAVFSKYYLDKLITETFIQYF